MTAAWFVGAASSVPQDESVVRSTVEPVRSDGVNAEAVDAPDFNEFETDQSGQLTGLSPRTVGAATVDTEKFTPGWLGLAIAEHNAIVDRQIASSGTAAKREERGEQGHGTMQYANSLEPVIRDGAVFGNEHFLAAPNVIQEGMGAYMSPADTDNWLSTVAQTQAVTDSRSAFQATQYQSFLGG